MEDLLKRLQNGETAEDIVAEFTAALNKAEDDLIAIQMEEERKSQEEGDKKDLALGIIDAVALYLTEFYGDEPTIKKIVEDFGDPSEEDLDSIVEIMDTYIKTLISFKTFNFKFRSPFSGLFSREW